MLSHPTDPARVLVTAREVTDDRLPEPLRPYRRALRAVVDWANRYLCRSHPDLGRRGAVCPFVRLSMSGNNFHLTVRPGRPAGPADVIAPIAVYRDWFAEIEPRHEPDSQFKTILVLFPDLPPADRARVIDATQRLLKPEYVARGLMIGEFHDGPPDKPGLWNPDFRPLRSPVPLLAIRHMVATDLAFLESDPVELAAYLDRFAGHVPAPMRPRLERALSRFRLAEGVPGER